MRTEQVNKLLAPLNPPKPTVPLAMEPETTGFSKEDIQLFSRLNDDELTSLAQYRSPQNQRTILHRLVLTDDWNIADVQTQFYNNLNILFSKWAVKLDSQDGEKLTRRALVNPCVSFVKPLIDAARKSKKLEIATGEVTHSIFEEPKAINYYLNSGNQVAKREACRARGIETPVPTQKQSQLEVGSRQSSTVTQAQEQHDSLIQQELALVTEKYEHSLKKAELAQREQELIQKKFDLMTEAHKKVTTELANLRKTHTATCEELVTLRNDFDWKDKRATHLVTELTKLREQHDETKTTVEKNATKSALEISELNSQLIQITKARDESIHELSTLKHVVSSKEELFKKENDALTKEVALSAEKIRVLQEKNRGLVAKSAEIQKKSQQLGVLPEVMGYLQFALNAIKDSGFVPASEVDVLAEAVSHSSVAQRTREKLTSTINTTSTVAGSASNVGMFSATKPPVEKRLSSQNPSQKVRSKKSRLTSQDTDDVSNHTAVDKGLNVAPVDAHPADVDNPLILRL